MAYEPNGQRFLDQAFDGFFGLCCFSWLLSVRGLAQYEGFSISKFMGWLMSSVSLNHSVENALRSATPLLWLNQSYQNGAASPAKADPQQMAEAESRLARFAPLLAALFPELADASGVIESPLFEAEALNSLANPTGGRLLLKGDHALPVAGSIKARGGIHEVLCFAESLALEHGLIQSLDDDTLKLDSEAARALFGQYTVAVGSTGNLGLSIGVMASALGFKAVVHMSLDAKQWKKERLRKRGVTVVEHASDYGAAVAAGRAQCEADPFSYFVDDESSPHLFMGYAVAASRLQKQLHAAQVTVDENHPLFVYLPAGVGGAPGGIAFGLKQCFGEHVHCFYAEPVQAPCMLLGLAATPGTEPPKVYEYGLNIDTDADGLAVGQASQLVCDATRHLISGTYTASDDQLYRMLYQLKALENVQVEPSAAIGVLGPQFIASASGQAYLQQHGISASSITHIAWLTGGSFVPEAEYQHYFTQAKAMVEASE